MNEFVAAIQRYSIPSKWTFTSDEVKEFIFHIFYFKIHMHSPNWPSETMIAAVNQHETRNFFQCQWLNLLCSLWFFILLLLIPSHSLCLSIYVCIFDRFAPLYGIRWLVSTWKSNLAQFFFFYQLAITSLFFGVSNGHMYECMNTIARYQYYRTGI